MEGGGRRSGRGVADAEGGKNEERPTRYKSHDVTHALSIANRFDIWILFCRSCHALTAGPAAATSKHLRKHLSTTAITLSSLSTPRPLSHSLHSSALRRRLLDKAIIPNIHSAQLLSRQQL